VFARGSGTLSCDCSGRFVGLPDCLPEPYLKKHLRQKTRCNFSGGVLMYFMPGFFAFCEIASKSRLLVLYETEALLLGLACVPAGHENRIFYYSTCSAGYTN